MSRSLEEPIFFVGMPRSGTTVVFECFASHPQLGWFSNHLDRVPRWPIVAGLARLASLDPRLRKAVVPADRKRPWPERLRMGPSEAYRVWESLVGPDFVHGYLLGCRATPEQRACTRRLVARVLRYEGRARFAAKITGPARMEFLHSIFPEAAFVHVIRDGRAVVRSLLRVDFWKDTHRLHEPAWSGGLSESELEEWEKHGRTPLALAALQWRAVIDRTREERRRVEPRTYLELRYEDFLSAPLDRLEEVVRAVGLEPAAQQRRYVEGRMRVAATPRRLEAEFQPEEWRILNTLLGERLAELGYEL